MERGPKKNPDLLRPTIEDAENATKTLASFYGCPNNNFSIEEPLTNREAKQRLLKLRDRIMDGTVNSHIEVAKVLWSLGSLISPIKRSASAEIDFAAHGAYVAVLQKEESFSD